MATEDMTFKIEKLTAENYHSWIFNMKMYLIGKDLWEIVTGTEVIVEDWSDAEKWKFKKRENLTCRYMSDRLKLLKKPGKFFKHKKISTENLVKENLISSKTVFRSNGKGTKYDLAY